MNDHDIDPLSSEAMALLEVDRVCPPLASDVSDRVFAHLTTSIAMGGFHGGSGGSGGSAPSGAAALTRRTMGWIAAAFVTGSGVGAVTHAQLATSPSASVPLSAVASATVGASASTFVQETAPSASASPVASSSASSLVHERAPAMHTASSAGTPARPPGKDVDLTLERALVERARMALARGQSAEALERQASEFPRGRMIEEREALTVHALVQAGRQGEARARAARFRSSFPQSVFLSAVDASLGARAQSDE